MDRNFTDTGFGQKEVRKFFQQVPDFGMTGQKMAYDFVRNLLRDLLPWKELR